MGLEFVKERTNNNPFDPKIGFNKIFKAVAFENGLICYPMGGTVDGKKGDHVLIAPPFIIEDNHIDELIEKLKKTLTLTVDKINYNN